MSIECVIFDLDDTLVNTSQLRELRLKRDWKGAVGALGTTTVFPGVNDLLLALRFANIRLGIVTTSVSFYASAVLKYHALPYDTLVAYHDAPRKPRPDGVHLALDRLKTAPGRALGVGDHLNDQLAYKAAGLPAIGAGWSTDLQKAAWTAIAPSPQTVINILNDHE